jgi:hypothetical protein
MPADDRPTGRLNHPAGIMAGGWIRRKTSDQAIKQIIHSRAIAGSSARSDQTNRSADILRQAHEARNRASYLAPR